MERVPSRKKSIEKSPLKQESVKIFYLSDLLNTIVGFVISAPRSSTGIDRGLTNGTIGASSRFFLLMTNKKRVVKHRHTTQVSRTKHRRRKEFCIIADLGRVFYSLPY